ncbi:MAG: SDR family NAD(P)-dependent oxidoreductase [Pseudomonadota bacterium]
MKPIRDQIILVTGATSGIGQQLAIDLSHDNQVYIASRSEEKLQSLIEKQPTIKGYFVLDIANKKQVLDCCHLMREKLQYIDLAVLNAGTCEYVDIDALDSRLFERVMNTNFMGTVYCVEGLLPLLRQSQSAQLSLMSSSAVFFPFTRAQAYGASKAAIDYLGKSLRVDLSNDEIHVSLIHPGFVKTPLTDRNDFDMPMMVDAETASQSIIRGLQNRKFDIHFPRTFTYLLKFMGILPQSLQLKISKKMVKQ